MSEHIDFIKLIEGSYILQKIRPYITKLTGNKIQNIKYGSLFFMTFIATSLLGTMVFFLFHFLVFYSSLRCILWLFECYDPINTTNEKNATHYVIETSAQDIIEYCIIPIFLRFVLIPLSYLPIPFITPIIYFVSIMISLLTITNKKYRQKLCMTIKYIFVNKNYVYGKEREIHKLIQVLVYSFDCVNSYLVNIINNPKTLINKLNDVKTFNDAFRILTTVSLSNSKLVNTVDLSDEHLDNECD